MSTVAWAMAAAGAFGATNIDSLVALTVQLSGGNPRGGHALGRHHALCGQYLALLVLLSLSALGAAGLLLLPARGTALFGLLPVGMGVHALVRARARKRNDPPVERVGRRSGTLAVALLAITCGGDNLAVYSPLLAHAGFPDALVVIAVFVALVPPMCALAGWLSRRAIGLGGIRALGEKAFPACLITLGLLVLRGALT